MRRIDALYPAYGFRSHVGYITPATRPSCERVGPSEIHRRSFRRAATAYLTDDELVARSLGPSRAARCGTTACAAIASSARTSGSAATSSTSSSRRGRALAFCEVKSKSRRRASATRSRWSGRRSSAACGGPRRLGSPRTRRQPGSRSRFDVVAVRDGRARVRRGRRSRRVVEPGEAVASTQDALYRRIDLDLSWSERELPERERTKHVHRLHPYLGKFIPQLVEALLERHVPGGGRVLDPFAGSGTTLVQALECGLRRVPAPTSRAVQLPADARQDARVQPVRARVASCATRSRGSTASSRRPTGPRRGSCATGTRRRPPRELLVFRGARRRTTSTRTCCASCSRARRARRGGRPTSTSTSRARRSGAVLVPQAPARVPAGRQRAAVPAPLRARHARAGEGVRARARARARGGRAARRRARARLRRRLRRRRHLAALPGADRLPRAAPLRLRAARASTTAASSSSARRLGLGRAALAAYVDGIAAVLANVRDVAATGRAGGDRRQRPARALPGDPRARGAAAGGALPAAREPAHRAGGPASTSRTCSWPARARSTGARRGRRSQSSKRLSATAQPPRLPLQVRRRRSG